MAAGVACMWCGAGQAGQSRLPLGTAVCSWCTLCLAALHLFQGQGMISHDARWRGAGVPASETAAECKPLQRSIDATGLDKALLHAS